MDCRIFYFSKWILPKIQSLYAQEVSGLTVGYFDFVTVEKINMIDNEHSFNTYVKSKNDAKKLKSEDNLELTKQDFFVFTNVGEEDEEDIDVACYNENKLESFWKDDSFIRFYSFLHISEGSNKKSVFNIIKKINEVFGQTSSSKDYNVICYFSLDYSDMIICSKCESILEYSKAVFNLNYNKKINLVKDSFSLISINNDAAKTINDIISNYGNSLNYTQIKNDIISKFGRLECFNDKFSVSLNLGIQNYDIFRKFEEDLIKCGIEFRKFKLLGRHDITINNNEADLLWLIIVQNYIDLYSICNEEKKLSYEDVIFNCETYIRLPFEDDEKYCNVEYDKNGNEPQYNNVKYNTARDKLKHYVELYCDKSVLKDEHRTPVYALYYSMLGLLKNGFAEDFVICIYSSFISFLKYLVKKIENDEYKKLEFDSCFNSYFDNINALTSSAMHSDRQFIQTPSFNPVFYDLPPKLMAYYTAVTNMVAEIMNTGDKGTYSFMFRPSFSRDIKITSFSYNEYPPTDRLLAVTINENDFYNPFEVACQMCHEVAHYVGDRNRNREYRKKIFLKCVLFDILYTFFNNYNIKYKDETEISICVNNLIKLLEKEYNYKNRRGYSTEFYEIIFSSLNSIYTKTEYRNITEELFDKYSEDANIFYTSSISTQFNEYLISICSLILRENINNIQLGKDIEILQSILSEVYADIQMILILDLDLNDYLSKFRKIDLENLEKIASQNETYSRILNVVMFFTFNERWKILNDEKNKYNDLCKMIYNDIYDVINYVAEENIETLKNYLYGNSTFDHKQLSIFSCEKSYWKRHLYWNINIQKYISEVYKLSVDTYNDDKKNMINKLNIALSDVKEFNNAIDIFTSIQSLNDGFADIIYSNDIDGLC